MNAVIPPGPPNPRFFHMPRFQGHQGQFNKQQNYMHQYRQHMLANQNVTFDGKHLRKAVLRKTVDYNTSVITYLQNRVWQRDHRDMRAIQAEELYQSEVVPPLSMIQNPMNCVTTKFVRTSTNKLRCPIFCVCWTPEGRRLVTGASSGEFTLWNGLTFNFETILQAHDTSVRSMVWSHNDMWMVTADHAGFVKYWQSNMNNVKMFQAHKEPIRGISFCPTDQKFASCSDDGTVRIWDFLHCTEERILRGHGADVKCVDWHPHKALVASGSKDTQQPVKLWDPKAGANLATIHAHKHTVMELKWNRNGNWLLTASRDHLIKVFDIRNLKEEMQTFKGHKKEATALAWHPVHESLFASGGSEGSLMFWIVGTDKEVGAMDEAHEGMVWSMAWHPLGHILVSGSNDHTTKFWSRNKPGDTMRDRYNLNLLPMGQTDESMGEFESEHTASHIPGMGLEFGLPEHLKQENKVPVPSQPVIPGLDFSSGSHHSHEKPLPKKKIPYSKPIPRSFEQAWEEGKQPALLGDASNNMLPGPHMNGPRGLLETPPRGPAPNMPGPRQGGPGLLGGPPGMGNPQRMPPPMQQRPQMPPQQQQPQQQQQQGFRPGGPQFQGQRFQQVPQGTGSPRNPNTQMNQVRGQFPNQNPPQNMGPPGQRPQFQGHGPGFQGQGFQGQRFQGPNQRGGEDQGSQERNIERGLQELRESVPTTGMKNEGFEDSSHWHQQNQNNQNMDFHGGPPHDFRNNDRRPPMQGQNRHSMSNEDDFRNNFNEGQNNYNSGGDSNRGRGMSHRGGRGRGGGFGGFQDPGQNNHNSNYGGESRPGPPSLLDMPNLGPPPSRKRPWEEGPGDDQGNNFGSPYESAADERSSRGGRGGGVRGGMMAGGGGGTGPAFRGGGAGMQRGGGMQRGRGSNPGWRGGGPGNRGIRGR